MKTLQPLVVVTALFATLGAIAPAASAGHADNRATPCTRSATDLFQACHIDALEEKKETIANCRQLDSAEARSECREEANAALPEEREACGDQLEARVNACSALGEFRYDVDPLTDPALDFVDPAEVGSTYAPNPYVSIAAGRTLVLRGGDDFEEIVVIHVTDDVREILGVDCRVVADMVFEISEDEDGLEYEAVEVTDDWFAQTTNGDVYYCGESVRDFEDGVISAIDGAFEAGKDFAKSGLLISANPTVGHVYRTEFALNEAEDIVEVLELSTAPGADEGGENPALSCADSGGCLKTLDSAPLDPESVEYKYYLSGVGFVLAVNIEDGEITEEREELVCYGDSLDIIYSAECGIESPEDLFEELCELNAEAFCD